MKDRGEWEGETNTKQYFITLQTFVGSAICLSKNNFSLTDMLLFDEKQDEFTVRVETERKGQCLIKAMRNVWVWTRSNRKGRKLILEDWFLDECGIKDLDEVAPSTKENLKHLSSYKKKVSGVRLLVSMSTMI